MNNPLLPQSIAAGGYTRKKGANGQPQATPPMGQDQRARRRGPEGGERRRATPSRAATHHPGLTPQRLLEHRVPLQATLAATAAAPRRPLPAGESPPATFPRAEIISSVGWPANCSLWQTRRTLGRHQTSTQTTAIASCALPPDRRTSSPSIFRQYMLQMTPVKNTRAGCTASAATFRPRFPPSTNVSRPSLSVTMLSSSTVLAAMLAPSGTDSFKASCQQDAKPCREIADL